MMFKLSNTQYDNLKRLAQIIIPALGALYFGLAKIWNLPYGTEICGTLALIDTFLGAILGYSSSQYWKGADTSDLDQTVDDWEEGDSE